MEKVLAHLRDRTDVKEVYVHDNAAAALRDMFEKCEQVAREQGPQVYRAAVVSLHACLANMFSHGFADESYVTRDGDLSLYVQEGSAFVFGIVWHHTSNEWTCHS